VATARVIGRCLGQSHGAFGVSISTGVRADARSWFARARSHEVSDAPSIMTYVIAVNAALINRNTCLAAATLLGSGAASTFTGR